MIVDPKSMISRILNHLLSDSLYETRNTFLTMRALKEIENYLMPFVKLDIPTLDDYFKALLKINYELIGEPI